MLELLVVAAVALVAVQVAILVILRSIRARPAQDEAGVLLPRLEAFERAIERIERSVREEIISNREESSRLLREQRQEMASSFAVLGESLAQRAAEARHAQSAQLEAFASQVGALTRSSGEKLDAIRNDATLGSKQLREEVIQALNGISLGLAKTMGELAQQQHVQLESMTQAITNLSQTNEAKLEVLRQTIGERLQSMQGDNARQLELMRATVDEKLQGTLEKRLGESFKQVSDRLEQVHKGLGEMQTLAAGVGDLKKVLTNVKTRGTWGEVQLGALLDQVLSSEQYARNVATRNDGERVEFAVKMPGQGQDEVVWLPIDAKFPIEDYQRLMEAQERADADAVESAGRQLEARVRACAADISDKDLNPPNTTDFGILYLPIEGLFAEVIRRTALSETIQRQHRVVIAGPTTLWSILNSLQMGFRTLAIQKRSGEVWSVLRGVKTDWGKYGEILEAVKRKLNQASDTIDKAQVRSRAIGRKLKDVEALPAHEGQAMLPVDQDIDDEAEAVEDRDLEPEA